MTKKAQDTKVKSKKLALERKTVRDLPTTRTGAGEVKGGILSILVSTGRTSK